MIMLQWRIQYVLSILFALSIPIQSLRVCGQCESNGYELTCPGFLSRESYTMQISDAVDSPQSSFYLKCQHDAQDIDFSLIADCDFSLIKHIDLHWCPMLNISFGQAFEQIGIIPENIVSFSFVNVGQRHSEIHDWHFDKLTNLKVLELKNNGFSSIPPHVFDNTPSLEHLMLQSNLIETLPVSLFSKTPNITKLDLQSNGFEYLPVGLFSNLTHLKNLSLWENKLSDIQPELLSGMPNLWSLELTYNDISNLDPNVFTDLKEIRKIILSYNKLESLPENIFHDCSNLQYLDFSRNQISDLPDQIFAKSINMIKLNFDYNAITELPENLFATLENLENLKFRRNSISTLPQRLFKGLRKLEVLDLQSNIIEELPTGIFDDLSKVDNLVLHNNTLRELPDDIFSKCVSLLKLYIGYNQLSTVLPSMFPNPSNMTVLDLSGNNISFSSSFEVDHSNDSDKITVQEYFPLSHLTSLTELYLQHNRIRQMPRALNTDLVNLKKLDLGNNSLTYLDHNDLSFKSEKLMVSLKNNDIKTIDINRMDFSKSPRKYLEIYIEDNPLKCDCKLYTLALLSQGKIARQEFEMVVGDINKVVCSHPIKPGLPETLRIKEVDTDSLTCDSLKCMDNCTCSTRAYDKMFVVDCSYQNLLYIPPLKEDLIPNDENYLVTMILKNNNITTLDSLGDGDYERLVNLTISNNKLNFVNESFLPDTLRVLDIENNNITTLSLNMLEFLNSTDLELSLGNNPWVCDCNIAGLYNFLRDPERKIKDIDNVRCSAFEDKTLIDLTKEDWCPLIEQPFVIASITAAGALLLIIAILATVSFYKYKQDIKVWLFTHRLCLWAVAQEEKDAGKKYDAFISYSDKDEEFVNKVLVAGLESGDPKYKVCLHYRDWLPGEYIQNQIDQSVEASRRTIVVLSPNFIENVWGHLEFKTAHSKALKDRTNRIIVIVLGEVPPDNELDEELKLYLSTRTYLLWKDDKFWEKLRYAMPHPPDLLRKRKKNTKETERLELSKTNGKQHIV